MIIRTADVRTLCAAIDDGDDSALLPLVDALVDAGCAPLAAGMRRLLDAGYRPYEWDTSIVSRWGWWGEMPGKPNHPCRVPLSCIEGMRERGGGTHEDVGGGWRWSGYPSRSAAYLALAGALADDV